MQREDLLAALAAQVRADHWTACFVVGWFAGGMSLEDLESLVTALEDREPPIGRGDHLRAYEERWGVRPRTRP